MKKNILIIGLASIFGIASGLISCSPDYETEFKVETLVVPDKSQAPITFPLLGGEHEIEVQTNVPLDRWSAQSNAEWCKVVQHEGKVVVSASANNIYKQRRAEITVAYGHQSYSITVSQFGKEPAILIGDKLQQEGYVEIIDAERETLTIPVATNLNLDNIIIPDTCNWSGKQAYNYIRFTPTARRNKDPLDYTVAGSAWWNMSEIYLYRIRHDEAWAREQLGI